MRFRLMYEPDMQNPDGNLWHRNYELNISSKFIFTEEIDNSFYIHAENEQDITWQHVWFVVTFVQLYHDWYWSN